MNKVETKIAWERAGLPTPAYRVIRRGEKIGEIPRSCVVKAIASGSSIDVYVCKAPAELPAAATSAIEQVLSRHEAALVEQFIDGVELTVGLLEERPLEPIRIVPKGEFFDYHAKYKRRRYPEHRFNTGLPAAAVWRNAGNWRNRPTQWLERAIWLGSISCSIEVTIHIYWKSIRFRVLRQRACFRRLPSTGGLSLGRWWIGS